MLKILRKKGVAKKILWVVAVVIILSFGFLGSANYLKYENDGELTYAGKVFGKKISFEEFEKNYTHAKNQAILNYRDNFNKISQFLNLDQETWDRIILKQAAKKERIRVANDEVIRSIEENSFFQRNGRFDSLLYNDILRYVFKSKPRDFEEGVRSTLSFDKLYDKVTAPAIVSNDAVFEFYKKEKEQVQVSYVMVASEDYLKEATYDETKSKEFFESAQNSFVLPDMINVEYIHLPSDDKTPPEEKAKIQEKSQLLAEQVKNNPDLKAVAAANGVEARETGLFSQEQPNLKLGFSFELLKRAFELNPGEISEPVSTESGLFILKLKEKQASHMPKYEEIRDKIKEAMLKESAKKIAKEKAAGIKKTIADALAGGKNFSDAAAAVNLPVLQSPLFSKGQYLPDIGISQEFQDAAMGLTNPKQVSEPASIPKGFAVLHLDKRQPASRENFEKEKEQFQQTMLQEKKNELFNDFLTSLRSQAKLQDNISKIKEQQKSRQP